MKNEKRKTVVALPAVKLRFIGRRRREHLISLASLDSFSPAGSVRHGSECPQGIHSLPCHASRPRGEAKRPTVLNRSSSASAPEKASEMIEIPSYFFLYLLSLSHSIFPLTSLSGGIKEGEGSAFKYTSILLRQKATGINSETSIPDKCGKKGVLLCTMYRTYLRSKSAKTPRFSPIKMKPRKNRKFFHSSIFIRRLCAGIAIPPWRIFRPCRPPWRCPSHLRPSAPQWF